MTICCSETTTSGSPSSSRPPPSSSSLWWPSLASLHFPFENGMRCCNEGNKSKLQIIFSNNLCWKKFFGIFCKFTTAGHYFLPWSYGKILWIGFWSHPLLNFCEGLCQQNSGRLCQMLRDFFFEKCEIEASLLGGLLPSSSARTTGWRHSLMRLRRTR